MPSPKITEGKIDFNAPSLSQPAQTWYRVYGSLPAPQGLTPLICLHGGPGACHNYLTSIADLNTKYGIPVILYDQIGNGLSTHLPDKKGDEGFWTVELFLAELDNLIDNLGLRDNFDILGQSWGGMIGSQYATKQPKGLRRLIIADSPADMHLWVDAQNRLRKTLPQDVQDVLQKCEDEGRVESEEYEAACTEFYKQFLCRMDPWPQDVVDSLDWLVKKDPTVYMTVNGPSEFFVTGPLKDWSIVSELHKIEVPVLLLNGFYDEAQDDVVEPFFREISKVKWFTFAESGHMPHFEEREKYMEVSGNFLLAK